MNTYVPSEDRSAIIAKVEARDPSTVPPSPKLPPSPEDNRRGVMCDVAAAARSVIGSPFTQDKEFEDLFHFWVKQGSPENVWVDMDVVDGQRRPVIVAPQSVAP